MRPAAAALAALLLLAAPSRSPADEAVPTAAQLMDDLMWGRGPIGGPFALIDQYGQRRTDRDFLGKVLLIYFGYTYCPDICPTDLLAITQAIERLGPAGEKVQPIFITVDAERDTQEQLATYAEAFHPRLVALTGTASAIAGIARAYKVYYAKVETSGDAAYLIDHTGFIYIVGPDGRYLGFLPPGTPADRVVEAVRPHLP